MKKFAIILSIFIATTMILSSCGKYEEGPSFTLLSKTARVTGVWTVTEVTVNGTVEDLEGMVMKTTLEKDGTGTMSMTWSEFTFTFDLEWEFDDAKENLRTRTKAADETEFGDWEEGEIIRLTNSECWVRTVETEGGVTVTTISKMTKE
ncbi:MAG: hypothetical protein PHH30_07985 [Bacteroidales bacterium]|nr:hypothetical protein [Bacteroidales bacterium]MDD3860182.1 hypothetical protein [Bacteroidales bacterium]